jgi:2-amino-4-hydroxy-6-hydroxymethyldihydropteridine diphosphokinase
MVIANIGLGSNLDNPPKNLERALPELAALGQIISKSRLYHTKPWGVLDQPNFCNAVLQLETTLAPQELLVQLKEIEQRLGRKTSRRWGPRLIDLDILTYGDLVVDEPNLTIPHLHMNDRAFVLIPLCDVDPSFEAALKALPAASIQEVELSNLTW